MSFNHMYQAYSSMLTIYNKTHDEITRKTRRAILYGDIPEETHMKCLICKDKKVGKECSECGGRGWLRV